MTARSPHSTWPEGAYALALTKPGTWQAQRAVVELMCAFAFAQGVTAGPLEMSERDVAQHLRHVRNPAGRGTCGDLLAALQARRVIRCINKGRGTQPSEWRLWHWTVWDVPWRVDRSLVVDRIGSFAGGIRALEGPSARVLVRAPSKEARERSEAIEALARGLLDPGSSSIAPSGKATSTNHDPRAGRGALTSSSGEDRPGDPSTEEEEVLSPNAQAVVETFCATYSCQLYKSPRARLARTADAAASAGCLDELLEACRTATTWRYLDRIAELEQLVRKVSPIVPKVDCPACGGTGLVELETAYAKCASCGGRGRVPYVGEQPSSTMTA